MNFTALFPSFTTALRNPAALPAPLRAEYATNFLAAAELALDAGKDRLAETYLAASERCEAVA